MELFPTSARIKTVGTCSLASRVGGVLAPFVTNLGPAQSWVPWTVFALSSLAAAAGSLFLPETAAMELPMTVREAEAAGGDGHRGGERKWWTFRVAKRRSQMEPERQNQDSGVASGEGVELG